MRTSPVIIFTNWLKDKHKITIEKSIIDDYLRPKEKAKPYFKTDPFSIEIIKIVAEFFNVSPDDLIGPSQKKIFSIPRQICMYFIEINCWISRESIGQMFNNRDHSTVTISIGKVKNFIDTDKKYAENIKELEKRIR